jgi:ATP-binding cassette subfamily B protein RaxB
MAWYDAISLGIRRKLPVILQTEAAECGLACLAMVLSYHGVITDLATLRGRHAVSMKGMSMATLSKLAQREQLGFRAVRVRLREMKDLRTPCVLHWDLSHFVVLKEVRNTTVIVHDPDVGEREYGLEELSRHFTGVALELWPDPGFKPREEKAPISLTQLIGQVKGFLPSLVQVLSLSLVLQLFVLIGPLYMQWIVDHVVVSRDSNLLTTLALAFTLVILLQAGIGLMRTWLMLYISTSIRIQWKSNIFSHMLRLPLEYFQKRHLGDIVSRTGSIDQIQAVLTTIFVETLFDGMMVILTLVMMFIYSPQLAWLAIVTVSLYLLLRLLWYKPLYLAKEEYIVRSAIVSTHYLETIRGMRAIKLFGRQTERRNAWQTLLISETNAGLRIAKLNIYYGLAKSILSGTFHILILWTGATQILAGNLSVGMLMAFMSYRGQFDSRVTSLIDQFIELRMLRLYGERLADVVLTPGEEEINRSLIERPIEGAPDIQITDLKFRYAAEDPWVLDGITVNIKAGEAVAITGPSGCGKTTLANLLLGALKPVEGSIQVGSVPLEKMGNDAWRRMVGTVMQDDTLFAGSIADNICFFDTKPDREQIEEAARLAAIHKDIEKMPMGYQTLVGDMGTVLSGGQKQRVTLARALYKKPQVLILDEATSHLDVKGEERVNASIASLNVTRIVIAHRPETIGSAQRVIDMYRGKIVYDGSPEGYFEKLGLKRPAKEE